MSGPLLEVERLTVVYKETKKTLVRNISFPLNPGEVLTILGQSGSGKTMTCRAILGILSRRAFQIQGKICFDGTDLLALKEKDRSRFYGSQIAFIPQNPMTALDPSRKIGRQMVEFLRLHRPMAKRDALSLCQQALAETGLPDTKRVLVSLPGELSGGMLQRVLIALAIAGNARLIIADEPTTALDAIHRGQAVEQLLHLRERGCALLLVTHDFDVVRHGKGRVLILKDGCVVEQGGSEEILQNPRHPYTKALLDAAHLKRG